MWFLMFWNQIKEKWANNRWCNFTKIKCEIQLCIYKCNLTICVFDTLVFQRLVNRLMILMNDDFDGLQINVV